MQLNFRILGFPITISLVFPIVLLVLGYLSDLQGIDLAVWVVLGIVAITVHELGHALAFRRFGLESSIYFWTLGGLAVPNDQEAAANLADAKWLVVSLAGPSVGLILGAAGLLLQGAVADPSELHTALGIWTFVNLGWGIFNLLPISGLDGGSAVMHVLTLAFGPIGRALALAASLAFSAFVAVVAAVNGQTYIAIIAVVFGLANPNQYRALFAAVFPKWAARRAQAEAVAEARAASQLQAMRPPAGYPFDDPAPGPAWPDPADQTWQRPTDQSNPHG
jgi:stage IV sporulation protein FB